MLMKKTSNGVQLCIHGLGFISISTFTCQLWSLSFVKYGLFNTGNALVNTFSWRQYPSLYNCGIQLML